LWGTPPGRALAPALFDIKARACLEGAAAGVPHGLAAGMFADSLRLELDPRTITATVPKSINVNNTVIEPRRYFVVGGEWDLTPAPFANTRAAVEMAGLIGADDITTCQTYRALVAAMEAGRPRQHAGGFVDSVEAIGAYCRGYIQIYEDMCANGFRTDELKDRRNADIGVAVGRDGVLVHFRKGHHRLALAQQADLKSVVATVRFIHSGWLREWTNRTGEPPHSAISAGLAAGLATL
jgi:hypothetical protein